MINSKNGFGEFELTALKISPVTEVPDRELFCRLEKKSHQRTVTKVPDREPLY